MLGDVGEPHRVGARGGEVALHEVVMDRRARRLVLAAALLRGCRPDPLLAAQPPHPPLTDLVAGGVEFVGQEPVAELGIIGVHVDDRVGEVRVVPVAIRARP